MARKKKSPPKPKPAAAKRQAKAPSKVEDTAETTQDAEPRAEPPEEVEAADPEIEESQGPEPGAEVVDPEPPAPVVIGKLRHWKQRFEPDAAFIWRRDMQYGSEAFKAGDLIPQALFENKYKLRLFWESKTIELARFETPPMHRASA